MPLSSSSMDRRIPEALSTSRERNLTVDPRAIGEAPDGRKMVAELRDALVTALERRTVRIQRSRGSARVEHFEVEDGRVTPGVEEVLAQAEIASEPPLLLGVVGE